MRVEYGFGVGMRVPRRRFDAEGDLLGLGRLYQHLEDHLAHRRAARQRGTSAQAVISVLPLFDARIIGRVGYVYHDGHMRLQLVSR
jgi:hypothetical protein